MFNSGLFNFRPFNASASSEQQPPVIIGGGDLGSKTAPFSMTYKVYDPSGEPVTVLEKLNGVVINTRVDVPQNTDLTFEITQALWDALAINSNHSIAIEATNERELSSTKHYTFYRQNNPPTAPIVLSPVAGASIVRATTIGWVGSTDPDAGQTITYKVYFSTNGGATKTQIAETAGTSVTWDVSGLTPGSAYQIFVCGYDGLEDGAFGASGVFRVLATPKRLSVPQFIEIRDIEGNTVALLSPESDGLKECWIDQELNGTSRLDFSLALSSPKWQYLTAKNRIHVQAQNRSYEFVIANPDAMERTRKGRELNGKVRADETWVLLGKKYKTISNDSLIGTPPWAAVVIVSGGTDLSGGRYPVGSAGHALYALLDGTGWTLGTVDVAGTYDLETEKESVLANINKVQELWGGYLVWDGQNKTVSLRSEASWHNYVGYQIRYGKNLKGITRYDDTDIVTQLYPFGENDLNIAAVNNGQLYLENHSYIDEELMGTWYNQDIHDQAQLKEAATAHLAKICKPRYKYSTGIVDLRVLDGYQHEVFALGDMVDVIDDDLGVEEYQRIIRHRFNVFQPWLCELDVGDPLEKIAASLANSIKVADYIKANVQPNPSFQNLLKAIINTAATEINGASGDYTNIDGVETRRERDENGNLTGNLTRDTPTGYLISSDGGQTWDLAINGKGVNASVINTGIINAALVNILSAGGDFLINGNGMKMYDADGNIRVQIGKNALNQYLIEIIGGNIYGTTFQSGQKGATSYVRIGSGFEPLEIKENGKTALNIWSSGGGMMQFYSTLLDAMMGQISVFNDAAGTGLKIHARNPSGGDRKLLLVGGEIQLDASGTTFVESDLWVSGSVYKTGELHYVEPTKDYGVRLLNALESPELKYVDMGRAQLENGVTTVYLDPILLQCIEPDTDSTPWLFKTEVYGEGEDIRVIEWGKNYFKVKECNGGTSNRKFGWWFYATRINYGGIRLQEYIKGVI